MKTCKTIYSIMKKNILYLLIHIFMVSFCVPSFSQGWEWDDADQTMYDNMERIETNTRAILPPNSSMSRYLPYVHHQGQTGMCVAYALASARTILYARNKNMYDQKEISRASFSPYFIYNFIFFFIFISTSFIYYFCTIQTFPRCYYAFSYMVIITRYSSKISGQSFF